MLTTLDEIKGIVRDRWTELKDDPYPEDTLNEWADSEVPIFYGDISAEWCGLPFEDVDAWREFGWDEDLESGGIYKLMTIDLVVYYERLFREAYEHEKTERAKAGDE